MSSALPTPDLLDGQHPRMREMGWRLLQPFWFERTAEGHVAALLEFAQFPTGARVLDVGCGVGECARLMHAQRPDLTFCLLNFSEKQLADCPDGFERHLANAHDLPFADESFDAVMFNAALGNMDAMVALAEASRVLKPGGVLLLNELARSSGTNEEMEKQVQFRAYNATELSQFAGAMGLRREAIEFPKVRREYLGEHMDAASYRKAFAGAAPVLMRFAKEEVTPLAAGYGYLFARHDRVALQISGGKDSLAVLYAMRPWWDRLCVYWLNTGDAFPEMREFMAQIAEMVPHFTEVQGRQPETVEAHGWPSDVVPIHWCSDGQFVFGDQPFKVQGRLDCCWRSLMLPMHERMVADGVTCVIRGKRMEEKDKSPTRTGSVVEGMELIYPIWHWSATNVRDYLAAWGVDLPESYQYAAHSLDCMSCTAWWGEGLSHYLKAKHPERFVEYQRRIGLIKGAINAQLSEVEV